MTVLCGGGTSSAQSNFGLGVTVGTGMIAALLNNVPTLQAVAMAAAIGVVNFELSTFCTTDPPAMPTFVAQDYFDLLGGSGVVAQLASVSKFRDALGNLLWPTFCKCDVGATPPPPALPAPPANLPTYQPPQLPTSPSSTPCWDLSGSENYVVNGQDLLWFPQLFPPNASVATTWNGNQKPRALPVPLPAAVTFTGSFESNGAATRFGSSLIFYDATQSAIGTAHVGPVVGPGVNTSVTATVPTNAVYATAGLDPDIIFPTAGQTAHGEVKIWCAGTSPTAVSSPCCPPDPALQSELDAIRLMVEAIYAALPHQLNSYADGVAHTGLSGNGTITLAAQVLGIRVNITTDPASLGVDVGDPNYLFDRGFIVPVVNAAPVRAESRLVYNPQMFLLPALTEQIGYSLHPGVVVTITELLRGP